MRFNDIRVAAGETGANPRTAPSDVLQKDLILVPSTLDNSSSPPTQIVAALEEAVAGADPVTLSVEIWVQADGPAPKPFEQADSLKTGGAERRFYLLTATPIAVTTGDVASALLDVKPTPGTIYVRVTTGPAEDGILRMGFA